MLVRDYQNAHPPLALWRPWLIPSPTPHGINNWKVLWGVEHPFDDKDAVHPPNLVPTKILRGNMPTCLSAGEHKGPTAIHGKTP